MTSETGQPSAGAADPAGDPAVDPRVTRLIAEVLDRRERGERVSESELITAHPELMPQLARQLQALRLVQRAYAVARLAGPIDEPLDPVDVGRIDAPIDVSDEPAAPDHHDDDDEPAAALPRIPGYEFSPDARSGGQATVYRARRAATGQAVAVKILPGGPFVTSSNRRRFEREADILAALDHPNVVGIVDRGRTPDGSFFLVMPFIVGTALDVFGAARRKAGGGDFPGRVLRVMEKVARAAHAAHAAGVVHRDLKPSNILVDDHDEPHVLDFGLARLQTASPVDPAASAVDWRRHTVTASGQVLGSLPWSSPEQAGGHAAKVDARADVYALGVCLYECLSGRLPLPSHGSVREALDHICSTPPVPLGRAKERLTGVDPDAVEAVVMRALAKSPDQRQSTAAAFADELRAVLDGRPVAPAPPPPPPPPPPASPVHLGYGKHSIHVPRWLIPALLAVSAVAVPIWYFYPQWQPAGPGVVRLVGRVDTNPIGMRMVELPAGRFLMGTPAHVPGSAGDEFPHEVRLSRPLWISEREVTVGDYENVMGGRLPPTLPKNLPYDRRLPLTSVSWYDAIAFCEALSAMEGVLYRLPTEAEWEYACRAGTSTDWAGDGSPDAMAWHRGNSGGVPHAVATRNWNHRGLRDMHGNVAEWCLDDYAPSAPAVQDDPLYEGNPAERVIRGGSFNSPPEATRSAARDKLAPDARRPDVGFRVVRDDRPLRAPASRPATAPGK